jgi:hypothetical protein
MDYRTFQNPPKEFREIPFWSWNDSLDPQELRRQIALMDEGGWGGFFMHARLGLRTPYMGPQWLDLMRTCIQAARERGMGAWLYDEDKWPSGYAGGLSVSAEPGFRAQYLTCKVDNRPARIAERIAAFSAREVDGRLVEFSPDAAPALLKEEDRLIQFYPQTMPLGDPAWFNEYAYLSLLNPEAVRAFLRSTHEAYARHFGGEFGAPGSGAPVPGLFTDEPCSFFYISRSVSPAWSLPWEAGFPAFFSGRNGYDLIAHLPALFFDTGDYHKVRYDFWRTLTELFLESYTKQIYDWCAAHNLRYTGHYMSEDSLLSQIQWGLSAAMPHYAYMHWPGIDKLGRSINQRYGTILTVKQLDSVACQLGKERALCEHYAGTGGDFAHAGRKWIGDWAFVLGINLSNTHLSLYSMRGERKRDFPPNLFYQQPWWPENRLIADYFARLSYLLSQGKRVVDVLVIHPMGSAWCLYKPGGTAGVVELDRQLNDLLARLLENQRDFHLGDELLMAPGGPAAAQVVPGLGGPRFQVGQMAYRAVIVPPGVSLARSTAERLIEFNAAGGLVIGVGPAPALVDGRQALGPVLPPGTIPTDLAALPGLLDELLPFDVRIPGWPGIWAHHRHHSGAVEEEVYFFANLDPDTGGRAEVQIRGQGSFEALDAATGQAQPLEVSWKGEVAHLSLEFAPAGAWLLVRHADGAGRLAPAEAWPANRQAQLRSRVRLPNTWELALEGPNALTLDRARVRLGEGELSALVHILDAHTLIASAGVGTPFQLHFTFDSLVPLPAPMFLIIESPERFGIQVNGNQVPATPVREQAWWVDIAFRKVDISRAVCAGRNEIVLSGVFGFDTELESVYLTGAFGVEGKRLQEENRSNGQVFDRYAAEFRLAGLPARLACSHAGQAGSSNAPALGVDLTAHGFPFYAGRAIVKQVLQLPALEGQALLEIEDLRAALAHVRVNGRHAGTVAWKPHRVDATAFLQPGENVIEIELVGTLRNLLGPHHQAGGDGDLTGPGEFRDRSRWTEDYILAPFGLGGVTLAILEE